MRTHSSRLPSLAFALFVIAAGCGRSTAFVTQSTVPVTTKKDQAKAPSAEGDAHGSSVDASVDGPGRGGADATADGQGSQSGTSDDVMGAGPNDGPGSGKPGTDPGSGKPGTDPGTVPDVSQIENACAAKTKKRLKKVIVFDEPAESCKFGNSLTEPDSAGNLGPRNNRIQARLEQSQRVDLPKGALVCNLSFLEEGRQPEQPMYYDDEIFFLFNEVVLASSFDYNEIFKGAKPSDGEFVKYDWSKLRGKPYKQSTEASRYCLGQDVGQGYCQMPATQMSGKMRVEIEEPIVHRLSQVAAAEKKMEFKLITTGDDDDKIDCRHSKFQFEVTVDYVQE